MTDLGTASDYVREVEERRAAVADKHGLTVEQVQAAERYGMDPAAYARWAGVRNIDQARQVIEQNTAADEIEREARRQIEVERRKRELLAEATTP